MLLIASLLIWTTIRLITINTFCSLSYGKRSCIINFRIVGHSRGIAWRSCRSTSPTRPPSGTALTWTIARAISYFCINTNGIFININYVLIWIGIPQPHLRRFRLAASAKKQTQQAFLRNVRFRQYLLICGVLKYFWERQIDTEHNSMQNNCRFSSWALI